MPELGQRDWSQGWRPDDDAVNGHPQGLLRMDNVNLDENGALSVVRGTNKVSTDLGSSPFRLFSRTLNGQKYRYAACIDGTVKRSVNESTTFSNIITGGSTNRCGFGVALGNVLITSGSNKKKDNGTVSNLGIAAPAAAPTIAVLGKSIFNSAFGTTALLEGTGIFPGVTTDATTGRAKIRDINSFGSFAKISNDNTELEIGVTIADSQTIVSVRIEYFLASGAGDASASPDYYFYQWNKTDSTNPFKLGLAQINTLKVKAKDVQRVGGNFALDWTNVETVILTIQSGVSEDVDWGVKTDFHFAGALSGSYTYYQVNVNNNGKYIAKSPLSALSSPVFADNQDIQITHGAIPADSNEIWIYRRKEGFNGTDTWYRVAVRTSGTGFTDNVKDQDAINLGIRINLNLAALPNDIIDILGNYGDRTLYLTSQKLYISDSRNPDAIDERGTLDFSGEQSEINLWIKKADANSVLVGTTEDIYEVQGTLELLGDGTIDARIVPLGIGDPPIAYKAACVYNHQVIYMARDGWRVTVGANAQSIVGHTRLLYRGITRHGSEGIGIFAQATADYDCTVSGGKLFVLAPFATTNARIMYVYDLEKKYWYPYFAGPLSLFTEEDGTILAGFADLPTSRFVRELETGTGIDQVTGWVVTITTPFLDAQMPDQRKDAFTLHIFADTGNISVNINYAINGSSSYSLLDTLQCNGPTHKTYEVNSTSINLAKTISLQLVGTLTTFKLFHWFIVFEPRPVQLNHLRIPPTDYGTPGFKVFNDFPMHIDTLGNTVAVTVNIDGANESPINISNSGKEVEILPFTSKKEGFNIGADLQASGDSVFEFYNIIQPRQIELLPDRSKWLRVPPTNFGIPSKKRVRTLPIVIDTRGNNVTLTPVVDGVNLATSVLNSSFKQTLFHYFTTDVFGIDFELLMSSSNIFEFYELMKPEEVEILPVGKKFDQIGPWETEKLGKMREIRVRLIAGTSSVGWELFANDVSVLSGTLTTGVNTDEIYTIPMTKTIKGNVWRLELLDTVAFHRYWAKFRYALSGDETSLKQKYIE